MLEKAADGIHAHVGQAGVARTGIKVDAVLPERRMHVHAGAVIMKSGLA